LGLRGHLPSTMSGGPVLAGKGSKRRFTLCNPGSGSSPL
jgi:hypothetical protein